MKLAIIVTEFPKTTETFILRDLMMFLEAGCDLRIYHLTPWRRSQILHDFAKPLAKLARHVPLAAPTTLSAPLRHPAVGAAMAARIIWHQGRETMFAAKSLALVPAAMRIGEELRNWGADHVHAEFAGHPATAAWIANAVSGVPYSVSCRAHDIFRSQRLLAQKFERASGVRAVSRYARAFLAERVQGLEESDVQVIHSSVDVQAIEPKEIVRDDSFRILYVGSLQQRKGVGILLKALAQFDRPRWSLDIAGDGPDRQALEAICTDLGLDDQVRFLGQLEFDDVTSLYHKVSVCVAPSIIGPNGRTEGIPNVMIEALAYQRPAISTRVSGIPELIQDQRTGWLTEPGDVDGLAAALCDVYDNPVKAARIAAAGRAFVAREFDLRVNARAQLDMFRSDRELLKAPQEWEVV